MTPRLGGEDKSKVRKVWKDIRKDRINKTKFNDYKDNINLYILLIKR